MARKFRLERQPGHLLRRCQQIAVELFAAETGGALTPRQFALLVAVEASAGARQTDLIAATGIDRSTLAEMVHRLQRRGLIRRKRTTRDGRADELTLAPAGRRALVAILPAVERAQARILAPIPKARRAGLLADLRLLAGMTGAG